MSNRRHGIGSENLDPDPDPDPEPTRRHGIECQDVFVDNLPEWRGS
jgi:hypothetical protein